MVMEWDQVVNPRKRVSTSSVDQAWNLAALARLVMVRTLEHVWQCGDADAGAGRGDDHESRRRQL